MILFIVRFDLQSKQNLTIILAISEIKVMFFAIQSHNNNECKNITEFNSITHIFRINTLVIKII